MVRKGRGEEEEGGEEGRTYDEIARCDEGVSFLERQSVDHELDESIKQTRRERIKYIREICSSLTRSNQLQIEKHL